LETLERLDTVDITEAELGGALRSDAQMVSQQINVTRAMDGRIVDGVRRRSKTDVGLARRSLTDPNWVLVATSSG
jgi:hypothetical protein